MLASETEELDGDRLLGWTDHPFDLSHGPIVLEFEGRLSPSVLYHHGERLRHPAWPHLWP
jgi:hypothetical protein